MTRIFACSIAAFSLVTAIGASNAADYGSKTSRQTVILADLDLSQRADAEVMLVRLHRAANNVCGGRPDVGDPSAQGHYDDCFSNAMSGAVAAVHSPLVAELYGQPASNIAAVPVAEKVALGGDESSHKNLLQRFFAAF